MQNTEQHIEHPNQALILAWLSGATLEYVSANFAEDPNAEWYLWYHSFEEATPDFSLNSGLRFRVAKKYETIEKWVFMTEEGETDVTAFKHTEKDMKIACGLNKWTLIGALKDTEEQREIPYKAVRLVRD